MTKSNTKFIVAGVSFRKTTLEIRNKFALTTDHIKRIYADTNLEHPQDFFILSTCNRTEVYSSSSNPDVLLNLLAANTDASIADVKKYAFVKEGEEAIKHLFRVAAGLDSQILGDYEIIGQLKNAFVLAKTYNKSSGFVEKLVNTSLQASRQVKSKTAISDGTTSVSYAVIQLLKEKIDEKKPQHICLLGLGKMGTLTLKNLKHYLPQHRVTIVNRNEGRAEKAAGEFKVDYTPFANQQEALNNADVLIIATGAEHAIISKQDIEPGRVKLIFDLSVPSNVKPDVRDLDGVQLYNIDELSQIVNGALESRMGEIPVAEHIIMEHFEEFKQWETRRSYYKSQEIPH